MSLELNSNKTEQVKEFEQLDLYDIEKSLCRDQNDMKELHCYDDSGEINETDVLNKYFKEDTITKDFLLLQYGASLYDISDFIEKFTRTDIKVFFYREVLSDGDSYFTKNRGMDEYIDFLDSVILAMSENSDNFQNISLCSYVLRLREKRSNVNASEEYLEIEKERLKQCLQENISIVEDIEKPTETYISLDYDHLTTGVIRKLLCDLETREENFTVDELNSIAHSVLIDKYKEEETGEKGLGYKERRSIVDLVSEKLSGIDSREGLEIYFKLILFAGKFGYSEFIESRLGYFYEEFEGVSKKFLIEKRVDLLDNLIDFGKKYDPFSFDIAKNLYESFKDQYKVFPKTTVTSFFMNDPSNDYYCNRMIVSAAKSTFVRNELLRYTYNECASSFDRMAWRLIEDSEDSKEYMSKVLSEKELPADVKLSLLMKMALRQLYRGDRDDFAESVELIKDFSKTTKMEEKTLVSLYGADRFVRGLNKFSAGIVNEDKKILDKGQKKENQELSRYVMDVFNEQFNSFFELLKNERILDQMDLYEASSFFISLDNTLLSVDRPDVNNHVKKYLEKTLDKYMEFYRRSPEKFFEKVGESYIATWEYMHDLFTALGVLSFYIDVRGLIYKLNEDGKARYTKYGFPLINSEEVGSIRMVEGGEVDRISKKYAEFLWDMLVKNNKDESGMRLWIGGLGWNFKHPSSSCLTSYNRELSKVFHLTDSRYHLNGKIFPILRRKLKEMNGTGRE